MEKEYANEPVSVAAIKADKEHDASIWSPRDALVDCLKKIDKGDLKPTRMIICYREGEPDDPVTGYTISGHDICTHVGMLERVKSMLIDTIE